ncbi:MAG: ABC transporter ATP-binding protein [Bacteroidota bacterium]
MELVVNNLSKTYPNGVRALKNVSLRIGRGIFGLLGQNRAGKSTLMRTIATVQEADQGSIHFNGIDAFRQPQSLWKILGYLPQEFGVYPNITAEKLLHYMADLKGIAKKSERQEVVTSLLEKVGLFDVRKKKLSCYSNGMKQRFGLAQVLIGHPKLIIVDEPTAGLAPVERNRFYDLLAALSEHKVVVLSTHLIEDVSMLCSDVAVMDRGEILLTGKPSEIENALRNRPWEVRINKEKVDRYQAAHQAIASRFKLSRRLTGFKITQKK